MLWPLVKSLKGMAVVTDTGDRLVLGSSLEQEGSYCPYRKDIYFTVEKSMSHRDLYALCFRKHWNNTTGQVVELKTISNSGWIIGICTRWQWQPTTCQLAVLSSAAVYFLNLCLKILIELLYLNFIFTQPSQGAFLEKPKQQTENTEWINLKFIRVHS